MQRALNSGPMFLQTPRRVIKRKRLEHLFPVIGYRSPARILSFFFHQHIPNLRFIDNANNKSVIVYRVYTENGVFSYMYIVVWAYRIRWK